jgi:mono/diheme cytochrome c family protein
MKKLLKIGGIILGVIVLLVLALVAFIQFSPLPTFETNAPEINVQPDSAKLAEGEKIVKTLCASCHMSDDGKLGGNHMVDAGSFGEIHSANLTNHPELGALSQYSDGEMAYLIRTGIKRDGSYAPPWMVKLSALSDYDMEAILTYLRSDAEELQASNNPTKPSKFNFLANALIKMGAFKPLPYPDKPIASPPKSDKVAYGKYLALSKYDCYACHSAEFATCDFQNPEKSVGFLGGGNPIPDKEGNIILSANLTMDEATGLGNWTEEQFIKAVKTGIRPGKIANRYPMMPYTRLEDEELSAIWAYLQTVPKIENQKDFTASID